jgi:DNA-binding CsgD family transcriptional regulator/tetratricopeptide (TPR) repeat protein
MPPTNADLEQGRELYAHEAWAGAFESLARADHAAPLEAPDLELLAQAAYLLGREDEFFVFLERAHHARLDHGDVLHAVRCAFWIGMNFALRGEMGPGAGWLGRAQRLLDRESEDCVERGYLLIPVAFQHEADGDFEGASATAAAAAEIGERFGDRDLFALAVHGQGGWLIKAGRVREGLGLLDEAMVAATSGELSPIVTGMVYCSVIAACEEVYDLRRAQEWTAALKEWCDRQPDLMAFTGRCMVHRAEIMQLHGAWAAAVEEAQRAGARFERAMNTGAAAKASYLQGDVHRLRGELEAAEEAYKEASRFGWEPQPGLALLRLAQGKGDAAAASIRRVMGETTDTLRRASLLPAYVQIMLAAGDAEAARDGCRELAKISERYDSGVLAAMLDHARGAVELADGDAGAALGPLRQASQAWQELHAPYETARVRVLLGLACRAVGDHDAFELELDAARATLEELGAAPDVAWVDSLAGHAMPPDAHGLTPRELEVLRLVATGKSNREIAESLVISEHTVARHVQNIFTKLGVPSRTAAGAFAFEHDLV